MTSRFEQAVTLKYSIYNSLFLGLPFRDIYRTGSMLPLLLHYCEAGYQDGRDPRQIVEKYFREAAPDFSAEDQLNQLFHFIQYIERQVVLFDSVEDAAFEKIHEVDGHGTVTELLNRVQREKRTADLLQKLDSFRVRVVLTAHPTQFYPGQVLGIITDLEQAIRANDLERIDELLQQLGKTPFINREKPSPFDEAVSLIWYLKNVFYEAVPQVLCKLMAGVGQDVTQWRNYRLLTVGFWPGGDRDGNPYVRSDTTRRVAQKLRETVLECYYRDIRQLRRRLTFRGVETHIQQAEQRIYATVYGKAGPRYDHVDELLADLFAARETLIAEHDGLFLELLDGFIVKVRTFAFFMACLDIRQDSRKHEAVWRDLLARQPADTDWETLTARPEDEQIETYLQLQPQLDVPGLDDFTAETLDTIRVIGEIQRANGEEACHRYVISNCQSALHVIQVFQLNRLLLAGEDGGLALDIVPLFETVEDLAHAPHIMARLYRQPVYRQHLQRRDNKQTIMLGFSDGTKDGGYLRANWSIFRAKEALTQVSREHGITVIFFDGRGGPPSRGGGNTHDFYASLGETIEDEEIQLTIQGQTISANYGKPASSRYNLEQLLSAGIENALFPHELRELKPAERDLMDELAEAGFRKYLELKHHPRFVSYLERVTPLRYFGEANIGSRPTKRGQASELKLEDLRAIPFVGAWSQMKQNIPGYFGVGAAFEWARGEGRLEELRELYRTSLFFRTLVGNAMQSLSKTFFPASAYLRKDPEYGEFWQMLHREYQLSCELVLAVSEMPDLLADTPENRASIKLRERMVLPLITMQQYALQTLRDSGAADEQHRRGLEKLVLRSMFGIINAARNAV